MENMCNSYVMFMCQNSHLDMWQDNDDDKMSFGIKNRFIHMNNIFEKNLRQTGYILK